MPVVVRIKPNRLGAYERDLAKRLPQTTRHSFERAGDLGITLLRAASMSIKDLGKYQAGWEKFASTSRLRFWNREAHGVNVEGGRGAGKRMPPDQPIREWAARHGIDDTRIFALRRAIGIRGIKPRPILYSQVIHDQLCEVVVTELRTGWGRALVEAARHG